MRWLLGFPAIHARLVDASIAVPGLFERDGARWTDHPQSPHTRSSVIEEMSESPTAREFITKRNAFPKKGADRRMAGSVARWIRRIAACTGADREIGWALRDQVGILVVSMLAEHSRRAVWLPLVA